MSNKTGNAYRKTSLRNGGRRAGLGMLHDDYGDNQEGGVYEKNWSPVRFPHDDVKPEELNGPVVIVQEGRVEVDETSDN